MKKQLIKSVLAAAIIMAAPTLSLASSYVYATNVEWTKGTNVGTADRYNPNNALGDSTKDFLSLGLGGYAVFSFGIDFTDTASLTEVTWGSDISHYVENATVYVAQSYSTGASGSIDFSNLSDWTKVADISNQDGPTITLDLPEGIWTYLAVVDTSTQPEKEKRDGIDIDTVAVLPVPEPATMFLFGFGLCGLAGLFRRKR